MKKKQSSLVDRIPNWMWLLLSFLAAMLLWYILSIIPRKHSPVLRVNMSLFQKQCVHLRKSWPVSMMTCQKMLSVTLV